MSTFGFRRGWAVAAVAALLAGVAPVVFAATPAAAATQATVSTEDQFWTAWVDPGITQIDLAASIQLHSGDWPGPGSGTCVENTLPERHATDPTLVDGHGFTLTQNCSPNTVLFSQGSAPLTVQNITITHAGAPTPTATGTGIFNEGDVTVLNSTVAGNWTDFDGCVNDVSVHAAWLCSTLGGGIASHGNVTVDGSTVTNNRAFGLGGGIAAYGVVTVTNSTVSDNQVTDSQNSNFSYGGGIFAGSGATVTNSTVGSNTARCDLCETSLGGGGIASEGGDTVVTGSNVTGNFAVCEEACGNVGGGILSGGTLSVTGSNVSSNEASCQTGCEADGGGIYASSGFFIDSVQGKSVHASGRGSIVTITDSSLNGNVATTKAGDGSCDCSGGAITTDLQESFTVTRSTIANNTAFWGGGASESYTDGGEIPTAVRYENSTITGNSSGFAGAIDARDDGVTLTLVYDTIDGNVMVPEVSNASAGASYPRFGSSDSAHSAIADPQPANVSTNELTSFGTVVTDPVGGANCDISAGTTSQGWNFSDDASCGFTNTAQGDEQNAGSPGLNPLGDFGGPTLTMLPLTPKFGGTTSPLIDAIPIADCQAGNAAGVGIDQRGVTRPQLNGCDMGAVEVTLADLQVEAAVIQPRFTG